jgi:putative selenate reductase
MPVAVNGVFKQAIQIVHIDDLCNECGNCGFFCPYDGKPYEGKPTLFSSEADLRASGNAGFAFIGPKDKPNLAIRTDMGAGSPVTVMSNDSWRSAAAMGSPMINIAKTVLENHRYLVYGGKA